MMRAAATAALFVIVDVRSGETVTLTITRRVVETCISRVIDVR